jgi:hypothetical protein
MSEGREHRLDERVTRELQPNAVARHEAVVLDETAGRDRLTEG